MVFQNAEPQALVLQEELLPAIDGRWLQAKAFTDTADGIAMVEVVVQDMKDEEEAVTLIRDDNIREYGMVGTAGTAANDRDTDQVADALTVVVVDEIPAVGLVENTIPLRMTAGTGVQGWIKGGHGGVEDIF